MCILIKNKLFLLVFVVKVEILFEIVDFDVFFEGGVFVLEPVVVSVLGWKHEPF